jgi:hypothetical protein
MGSIGCHEKNTALPISTAQLQICSEIGDVVEEVSACFPHGSMIPSSHWLHEEQIELSGDMLQ